MSSQTNTATPPEIRAQIRRGEFRGITGSLAPGYVQANLAVLPRDQAFDFLLFCQRNSRACPLLEVLEPGCFEPREFAPGADLRTDLPRYRVFREGNLVGEEDDIRSLWRDDLVSFLLGCSFTFDTPLSEAGIPTRHLEEGKGFTLYVTDTPTDPAGPFSGPLVVSMRPVHRDQIVRAVQVTSRYSSVHGAPVHIGDPSAIGIRDIARPDYGEPIELRDGEVPVFWACGVTPQEVALRSRPPFMITHSPGHMFITDRRVEDLAVI